MPNYDRPGRANEGLGYILEGARRTTSALAIDRARNAPTAASAPTPVARRDRRGKIDPPEKCTGTYSRSRGGGRCSAPGWWCCNDCGRVRCGRHSAMRGTEHRVCSTIPGSLYGEASLALRCMYADSDAA